MALQALPQIPTGTRGFMHRDGRARKFLDPDELLVRFCEYFDMCERNGKPYTMTGLSLCLGVSPHTLLDYEKLKEFNPVIRWAKSVIIDQVEARILEGLVNPMGLALWLKNYADYKDKSEVQHTGEISLSTRIQEARRRVKGKMEADAQLPAPQNVIEAEVVEDQAYDA